MRTPTSLAALLLPAALLTSCGVRRYLPGTAVLSAPEVAAVRVPAPAAVVYTSPPRQPVPALPVQVFGLYYGLDIVIVSNHPAWDMHEYARVDLPTGPLWLAKDSRAGSLVQGIVADLPEIETFLPEVAVPRRQGAVTVEDRSDGDRVDLRLSYQNLDGEAVEVEVQGRVKARPPKKRNGSTMGHSRQSVAVVLDLERFGPAGRVRMHIGGERRRVRRLLGLVPLKFLLQQAQGGLAATSLVQGVVDGGLSVDRPAPGAIDPATGQPGWPTRAEGERWTLSEQEGLQVLEQQGPIAVQRYVFQDGELLRAEVWQAGRTPAVTRVSFHPALPDLRRGFTGTAESRFEIEIDGLPGHGTGMARASWLDADTVGLELVPSAPWWLADRPMEGTLRWLPEGGAALDLHRKP